MKHLNATITVVLSKAQILEILFAIEGRTHVSWDLKHAQKVLRRAVREPKATQAANQENQNGLAHSL